MRLRSLDVFRGVTMAAMVIVNNPGDWGNVYSPLLHAEWHGWTPTDLIFPFFLFIVGVSMTFAPTTQAGWGAILRRTVLIFGLGLFLSGFPYYRLETMRIPGVLQRIALCYLASAAVMRAAGETPARARVVSAAAAVLLLVYFSLITYVPVPGGAAGDLAPGKDLGAWLDRALLGGHLWKPDWDPEGLLSTMPAIATTLLGVLAGWWVRESRAQDGRVIAGLAVAGVVGIAAGYAWHPWFPINKNLWTSSYVLLTAGAACLCFAACYSMVDAGREAGASSAGRVSEAFVALGRNAILLFVVSGLLARTLGLVRLGEPSVSLKAWIYTSFFTPLASPVNASLLFALTNLALLWALLWQLHRRGWYLKV